MNACDPAALRSRAWLAFRSEVGVVERDFDSASLGGVEFRDLVDLETDETNSRIKGWK